MAMQYITDLKSGGAVPQEKSELKPFSSRGSIIALSIAFIAVIYNAVLAALSARGLPIGYSTVAQIEVLLILSSLFLCIFNGLTKADIKPLALVWFIVVLAILLSIKFETFFIASTRNFLIIAAFCMLGQRMDSQTVRRLFFITSVVTLLVLVWEISSLESYAKFFSPAHYYEVTRGTPKSEFDNSGLSVGTVTFEGRFSFGIFSGRRTSSIFLEQVGINAYAIVCMVFLNGFWGEISKKEKFLQIFTIALIITSNNARMASLMCLVMPIGYFVFPLISRFFILLIPLLIITLIFAISPMLVNAELDDLMGRLAVTYRLLNVVNYPDLIFGNPNLVSRSFDTGYGYLIASVGLFGSIAFVSFLVSYPKFESLEQRRGSWSTAIYILLWLTVGGTGVFSIKTASLMWVMVGSLSYRLDSFDKKYYSLTS